MNKKEILCYETDASRIKGKAEKIVFPKKIEEIANIIRTTGFGIVPRGSGTGVAGGAVPNSSVVVDLGKMNKILGFDRIRKIVHAEAGICIKELNEKLNAVGFEFPVIPVNDSATIGGMIALNSFDSRSMKYGKMKDWVEEIEFVNGKGELLKTSRADLGDICGMEGITGIIAVVKLKVIPKIKRSISLFQSDNIDEILNISRRLRTEKDVVALNFFPKSISEMLGLVEENHLIIEFDSERGKIKDENYEKIIDLKRKVYYSLAENGYYNFEASKFFLDKLKDFILFLESTKTPYFSHLGAGIVHCFFKDDETEKQKTIISAIQKIGGRFEFGFGIKRKNYFEDSEKKIINRVKLRYDPFGRLNKGKVIDFEPKVNVGRHLKPLGKQDIDLIKPSMIDRATRNFIQEKEKSPEEKFQELVKEAEADQKNFKLKIEDKKEQVEGMKDPYSTEALLKEYEQTYESELADNRKNVIEEFARNVPRQTISREIRRNVEENIASEVKKDSNIEKKGKLNKEEEEIINKIMSGNFILGNNKNNEEK